MIDIAFHIHWPTALLCYVVGYVIAFGSLLTVGSGRAWWDLLWRAAAVSLLWPVLLAGGIVELFR